MIMLTSIAILFTVTIIENDTDKILGLVTVYVAFSIVGLLDIIIFYVNKHLLPKHIESFSLAVAFIVELVVASSDYLVSPVINCWEMAILGSILSSVMRIVYSSYITTFSLVLFTMIQGTFLLHSSFLSCGDKMIYLYLSWHILAVFISILVIVVVMNMCCKTHLDKHKTREHESITASVEKMSDVYSETNTGLTLIAHDVDDNDDCCKEIVYTKNASLHELENQIKEEQAIKNVLQTIDLMVNEAANNVIKENTESDFEKNTVNERLSPLEEFNTLHKHISGVRASIKLKESNIV